LVPGVASGLLRDRCAVYVNRYGLTVKSRLRGAVRRCGTDTPACATLGELIRPHSQEWLCAGKLSHYRGAAPPRPPATPPGPALSPSGSGGKLGAKGG